MPWLFATTMFVSASLLFMVQPMVGKMVLPLLGGSPASWNTCMVFFQALLLLGYLYSHYVTSRYKEPRQAKIHLVVIGGAMVWMVMMAMLSARGSPIPIFKSLAPQGEAYPMFGVLMLLFVAIGIPFLVVSTSAPLFQRWFSYTGEGDPYFLYAASNAGSLISLLGYPLLIEPMMPLLQQAYLWAGGFLLLLTLAYFCGKAANSPLRPPSNLIKKNRTIGVAADPPPPTRPAAPPTLLRRLRWLGLAFVPSSLMLGVTFHMTTDIASVPLLWVIPLALYLLTFIIAYGRQPSWYRAGLLNLSPVLSLLLVFVLISNVLSRQQWDSHFFSLVMHLSVYFFTALLMHSDLAHLRPGTSHLTEYYLWISLGGVLGGIFNALIAPMLFPLAYEYPIAVAIGCLLIPTLDDATTSAESVEKPTRFTFLDPIRPHFWWMFDVLVPLGLMALVAWLTVLTGTTEWFGSSLVWVAKTITTAIQFCGLSVAVRPETVMLLVVYALPCMLCFLFIDRPVRFGLCVAAVLLVAKYREYQSNPTEWSKRSFFGILRVEKDSDHYPLFIFQEVDDGSTFDQQFHTLHHGTTLHGKQAADRVAPPRLITDPQFLGSLAHPQTLQWGVEALMRDQIRLLSVATPWDTLYFQGAQYAWDAREDPLTYYHRTGPVGEIVSSSRKRNPHGHIAMIGLGTGSIAAYARKDTKLTFYEIDPTVIDLVQQHDYFTFVQDAQKRGAEVEFTLGDARLKLEGHTDRRYDLLLVDAFSSDSIPVHMLTLEAVQLYKQRIKDDGLLAIHISNRYIMLEPVVGRLAKEAGMVGRVWSDSEEQHPGKTASSWVVLAKTEEALGQEFTAPFFWERAGALAGPVAYLQARNTYEFDYHWQPLDLLDEVDVWTDDYSDVLRVMRLKEIRAVRRFFGLPIPKDRGN